MKKRLLALACAAVAFGSVVLPQTCVAAAAEGDGGITVVQIEKSKALAYQPESEITGEIAIVVAEHPVHVNITMYSSERPVVYYDVDLTASENTSPTKYIFPVDHSEYPIQERLSEFQNTYTEAYFTGVYSSCYQVTISVPDTEDAIYTEESVLVADPHADAVVTGKTRYIYTVNFDENMEQAVSAGEPSVSINDGNAEIRRNISMLWKPYALADADDNGVIDMTDAYLILLYNSYISAGGKPNFEINTDAADVDKDGSITMQDAYLTLLYTSYCSAGMKFTFEEFMASDLH